VTGRVVSRTVSDPIARADPVLVSMRVTANSMAGWLAASRNAADFRWASRLGFPVSSEAVSMVSRPRASLWSDTVADPGRTVKVPFTGTAPNTLRVAMRAWDRVSSPF
jgi:hypothetical protein